MNMHFSLFLDTFGPGNDRESIPDVFFDKYKDTLPNGILEFWREEGLCSYHDGLLWTVNPDDYSWLIDGWVRGVPSMPDSDYYIFARSAFGEFFCLSLDSRRILTISCPNAMIFASKLFFNVEKSADIATQTFFATADMEQFDYFDIDGAPLFEKALKKLGALGSNEIYGFVPILPLGGLPTIDNLQKLRMDVHIDIIRQAIDPELRIL